MGIPVIFVSTSKKPAIPANGTFLDNLTHCYSESEYADINWYPEPVEIEHIKKLILHNAETAISETYEKNKVQTELTDIFSLKREYSVSYTKDFYLNPFPKRVPFNEQSLFRGYTPMMGWGQYAKRTKLPFVNYFLLESIERLAGKMVTQMRLVIFGAGNEGKVILYELKHLPRKFLSIVFIDNNEELYSKTIDTIPVFPVAYLQQVDMRETFILLAGSYHETMAKQLEDEFGMREQVHFWKACRIISTNLHDFGYGPIITPSEST
jgi:FlaA1/EpsC-like NDP-sugar epimerase